MAPQGSTHPVRKASILFGDGQGLGTNRRNNQQSRSRLMGRGVSQGVSRANTTQLWGGVENDRSSMSSRLRTVGRVVQMSNSLGGAKAKDRSAMKQMLARRAQSKLDRKKSLWDLGWSETTPLPSGQGLPLPRALSPDGANGGAAHDRAPLGDRSCPTLTGGAMSPLSALYDSLQGRGVQCGSCESSQSERRSRWDGKRLLSSDYTNERFSALADHNHTTSSGTFDLHNHMCGTRDLDAEGMDAEAYQQLRNERRRRFSRALNAAMAANSQHNAHDYLGWPHHDHAPGSLRGGGDEWGGGNGSFGDEVHGASHLSVAPAERMRASLVLTEEASLATCTCTTKAQRATADAAGCTSAHFGGAQCAEGMHRPAGRVGRGPRCHSLTEDSLLDATSAQLGGLPLFMPTIASAAVGPGAEQLHQSPQTLEWQHRESLMRHMSLRKSSLQLARDLASGNSVFCGTSAGLPTPQAAAANRVTHGAAGGNGYGLARVPLTQLGLGASPPGGVDDGTAEISTSSSPRRRMFRWWFGWIGSERERSPPTSNVTTGESLG